MVFIELAKELANFALVLFVRYVFVLSRQLVWLTSVNSCIRIISQRNNINHKAAFPLCSKPTHYTGVSQDDYGKHQ